MSGSTSRGNREASCSPTEIGTVGRPEKPQGARPWTNGLEESDRHVVPTKSPNNDGEEPICGGGGGKVPDQGEASPDATHRTPCRTAGVTRFGGAAWLDAGNARLANRTAQPLFDPR